jgi:hypothetical protein
LVYKSLSCVKLTAMLAIKNRLITDRTKKSANKKPAVAGCLLIELQHYA